MQKLTKSGHPDLRASNRGKPGKAGRKPKHRGGSTTISFRVPIEHADQIKTAVKRIIAEL